MNQTSDAQCHPQYAASYSAQNQLTQRVLLVIVDNEKRVLYSQHDL
jgi:hypothetical protein